MFGTKKALNGQFPYPENFSSSFAGYYALLVFLFFLSFFFNVVVFLIIKPCKAYCLCRNDNLLSVWTNIWRIYALVLSFLSGATDHPTVYESLRRPDIGLTSEYAGLTGYQNTVFITDTGMIVSADFQFQSHSAIAFQSRRTQDKHKTKRQYSHVHAFTTS